LPTNPYYEIFQQNTQTGHQNKDMTKAMAVQIVHTETVLGWALRHENAVLTRP